MRAVVLRDGRLHVRETPDPIPGPGELLLKTLSTAICASDVHFMDHPELADGPTGRSHYDAQCDIVLGHEFVGEVVAQGPGCSADFPVGARVTSIPIRLVNGGADGVRIIGQHPEAQGSFGAGLIQKIVESSDMGTRIYCAGGWYTGDSLDISTATRQGVTVQFGGGPMPEDWYGTLDAIVSGALDPLPSVGSIITLDDVPDAIDMARRSDGPPRIIVHPNGDPK